MLRADDVPPLTPDEPTGREWLLDELSKPEYVKARPNPIELWLNDVWEWFRSLFVVPEGSPFAVNPLAILLVLLIVGAIIALIVWGRPRAVATRRGAVRSVFLDDDTRSAQELREAARTAAAAGDWSLAITEQFRALARDLTDRTIIAMRPGTTAQAVAASAASAFPDERSGLAEAADRFDAVRYLGVSGDETGYRRLRELDDRIQRTRPASLAEPEAVR